VRRLLTLSALIYALIFIGLSSLRGEILALALPLILYLGASLLMRPERLQLQIERQASAERVEEGSSAQVTLSVRNQGAPLQELLFEDLVPAGVQPQRSRHRLLAPLAESERLTWSYRFEARRGSYDFDAVQVTARDPFGLFHYTERRSAPWHIIVMPRRTPLRRLSIRPLATHGYAGPVPARVGGSGVDFFGVRAYQPGDPLRWINWRISARHRQALFTNEFQQERIADVGVILDARRRSDIQGPHERLFDHGVRAAASLAEAFLGDGNRVGLLVYGGFLDWVFPGYGKQQRERIMRALATAKTGESLVFETLDYLPTRFFPARSQIVLVSPLCREDQPVLFRLRARGYQLLVVSPDPVQFEASFLDPTPETALALRIANLERTLLFRRLRRAGVQIVDWRVDRPLSQAVRVAMRGSAVWARGMALGVGP
jgi:uncharacterized protein (DUF58 family)